MKTSLKIRPGRKAPSEAPAGPPARRAPQLGAVERHGEAEQPDANALEFFALVAHAGSFAEAARQLALTRAAVSRRVAQLEAHAGGTLFVRSTRQFGLTERGRELLVHARAVTELMRAARAVLRERPKRVRESAELVGTLRITSVPSFGQEVLAPLLAAFQARHPQLRLQLRFTTRRVDLVREEVDVAFRLTERPPEDCIAQPVLPFAVHAYAAPQVQKRLIRPAQLSRARCLAFGPLGGSAVAMTWLHERRGRREDVTVEPAVLSEDLGSLIALACAGGGIVFAPDFGAKAAVAAGRLIDVLPSWRLPVLEGDSVQALTLPLSVAPRAARALVAFVRDALGTATRSSARVAVAK